MYVDLEKNRMYFFLNNKKIHNLNIPHNEYIPAVDVYKKDVRTLFVPGEILNQI